MVGRNIAEPVGGYACRGPREKRGAEEPDVTRIREFMTTDVVTIPSTASMQDAAALMRQHDIGSLPVVDGDILRGMLTDRDLVVRGLADGIVDATVSSLLSGDVVTVNADDEDNDVAALMSERQVRRVPVVDGGRLVGMVSMGDLAARTDPDLAAEVLQETGPSSES